MIARTRALVSVGLLALIAAPAWAQNDFAPATAAAASAAPGTGQGLEDIVVTAQRRRESAQTVPIAITAFSASDIATKGITQTLDLVQFVPNVFGGTNTGLGSANTYYIRGLGNTESIGTFDPPVGTYVDEIYLARQNANSLDLFDVERVEVLRGPQGTLFGRNTTGGAISVTLREPGKQLGGFVEGAYGRFDRRTVRASIDVPLADSFAIKISGYRDLDNGYVKNVVTNQELNSTDNWGVRLGVRADLSAHSRWTGSYLHNQNDTENLLNFLCNPANPTQCNGRYASTGLRQGSYFATSPYLPLVVTGRKSHYGLGSRTGMDLVASNFAFGLADKLTLNVITGYVATTDQFALDFFDGRGGPSIANPFPPVFGAPRGAFTIANDARHYQFTQEVKVNGSLFHGFVDFVSGFYYFDEDNRTDFADIFTVPLTFIPGGFPLLLGDRTLTNRTSALAGYTQADFNITHTLKLTAGVRYTDERKTFSIHDNRAQCQTVTGPTCLDNANLIAPTGVAIPQSQRTDQVTPRFAINYTPVRDVLLYASATRGFKSGGWNARAYTASQLFPFGPEKAWTYEAGGKTEFFDRRLRANVTLYWEEVSDLQTPSASIAANGSVSFITRNFANYRNRGIEAEFTAVPVQGLNLYANVGYQNDRYEINQNAPQFDQYGVQSVGAQQAACRAQLAAGLVAGATATTCAAGIVDARGNLARPVRTPAVSLALGGNYEAKLGQSGLSLIPSVNATYRSDYQTGTSGLSIYNAPITSAAGVTYPANPLGNGAFIAGSDGHAYWLLNASVTLAAREGRYRLSLECQNCLDRAYEQSDLANYVYYNTPMTWTVRGRVAF